MLYCRVIDERQDGDRVVPIRVLVVADDPSLLRATTRQLERAGYEVCACSNGENAVQLVEREPFDVVVSDISMPGLTGIDLLKLLRELRVEIPVILVTGAPALQTAIEAVEYGAFKYLTKPVQLAELLDALKRAAALSRHSRERSAIAGAAPPSIPTALVSGLVLGGRYRLDRLLGQGGMGEVWEATHLLTERPVAVKLVRSALNAQPPMRLRLLREARAAGSIDHPHVVAIYDTFELADGTPVMVMARLRGETLRSSLARRGALPLPDAADVLLPVVSAVGTAHAYGIVHRDLKPDNVFLAADDDGRVVVKVLDFGIAKLLVPEERESAPITASGILVGTPGYMAPEQGFGERDVDQRADVWSIGAILYESLTGVRAIPGDELSQILRRIMTEGAPRIEERLPAMPADVGDLLWRMLAADRRNRPDDLHEAYDVLSRYARASFPAFGAPLSIRPSQSQLPEEVSKPGGGALALAPTQPAASIPMRGDKAE